MEVYLSLGANIGNREETIERAIRMLEQEVGPLLRRSDFYYSAPVGFESPNMFCNLCCCHETTLSPMEVLDTTLRIERALGRTTKSETKADGTIVHHDRTIDIDIILYEGVEMETEQLTLPHPRYQERDFVLVPLRQIKSPAL